MSWAPYDGAPGASYFEEAETASVASLPNFLTATSESAAVVVLTPSDVMPAMGPAQRRRAEGLMRRQRDLEGRLVAEIDATTVDLGSMRQRRRAAVAYGRT